MAGQEPTTNTTMPAPKTSPAMREFGFGADRVLRPYQNPEAKSFFRTFRPSEEERNSLGYDDYARQQDNLVLQEDLINQQLEDKQAERQQAQRKVARLEQIEDVEDQANEAIAQGVPMDQVIQQFPALAQSPSFGNYMQQVRAIAPAQQTLAPSFRKLLRTPEERADFDEAFQKFGNVTQADDHARARHQEREHRVSLIDAGVPLAEIEKAGPLTPERAALLKQQYKRSVTGGDPRADKVFDTYSKLVSEGFVEEAREYVNEMKSMGIDITPPVKVVPQQAPVAEMPDDGTGDGSQEATVPPVRAPSNIIPPEQALKLKQLGKAKPDGDPRADKVFDTMNKMLAEGVADEEVKAYLERMKSFGIDIMPKTVTPAVNTTLTPAERLAQKYGILKPKKP